MKRTEGSPTRARHIVQFVYSSIALTLLVLLFGCSPGEPYRVTEEHMGTWVTITVGAEDARSAAGPVKSAFEAITEVDKKLSHYGDTSEVARLNDQGYLDNPSPMLLENLRSSLAYARLSGGAFDITVLPILDLYDHVFGDLKRVPTDAEIAKALERVDYTRIRILGNRVELGEGQRITLGGIAKGYAIDLAIKRLTDAGIRSAIVEAGGDLRVIGKKTAGEDWHIAIQNPRDSSDYVARLRVPDKAVVTSGDYERYYDSEHEYHHIINPKTGRSATELISVTVISDTAFAADALSTTAFVLGPEKGLDLIESLDGVEAMFITRSRQIIRSSGFSRYEVRT